MARTYDPVLGRYLETDPIDLASGVNLYSYTRDAPETYIDSDAKQWRTSPEFEPEPYGPRNPRVPRGGNGRAPRDALDWMAERYRVQQTLPPWLRGPPPTLVAPPGEEQLAYDENLLRAIERFWDEMNNKHAEDTEEDEKRRREDDADRHDFGQCKRGEEEREIDPEELERRREDYIRDHMKHWEPVE